MWDPNNTPYYPTASRKTVILVFATLGGFQRSSNILSLTSSSSINLIWPYFFFFVPLQSAKWHK